MHKAVRKGLSFGATSGVITVLGLISGLAAGTHSKIAVIGGIVTIAIADSFSDAFGMHTAEESSESNQNHIWTTTGVTLIAKLVLSSTFLIPVLIFDLNLAVVLSCLWGALIISLVSLKIAQAQQTQAWKVISEHLAITIFVVVATTFAGQYVNGLFNG